MADLLSYALTSVADVKESMGISGTSQDNLIKRKINQATMMIESFCGLEEDHHFKETTYTNEVYDGTYTDQIVLRMRPVTSISSFQYRNTPDNTDNWTSINSQDYFSNLGSGLINGYDTLSNYSGYRISYTAGYSTIPADLAEACVILASYLVENSASGSAIKRKREGGREIEYAVSLTSKSLIESLGLDEMLSRYVMYIFKG